MLKWMLSTARGVLSLTGYFLNSLISFIPIMLFSFLKLIIPLPAWRSWCSKVLNTIALTWIAINKVNQRLLSGTRLKVRGGDGLQANGWYLVLANHQSWVDILVLQQTFHQKIPFLTFFLKKELFWVPILGLCWWALDFPFMKRYSKTVLKKNPHLKGKDLETTREACEKFKTRPVSIMNFVEGTRFTPQKRDLQNSPYRHLLKTRAGGVAHVIAAMSEQLHRIVDVTIVYPHGRKSFWAYLCGEIEEIIVYVNPLEVTEDIIGDYSTDRAFRIRFHQWLNTLWSDKDQLINTLAPAPEPATGRQPAPAEAPAFSRLESSPVNLEA